MTLAESWRAALAPLEIRHPNGRSRPVLRVLDGDPPSLYVGLDETTCTQDPTRTMRDFAISTVKLMYFPGAELARRWLAAAWVGYLQHEALELVRVDGVPVLNPHDEPYEACPWNRGLRAGFPVELWPGNIDETLALVMPREAALDLASSRPPDAVYPSDSAVRALTWDDASAVRAIDRINAEQLEQEMLNAFRRPR